MQSSNGLCWEHAPTRLNVMCMIIKMADINGPTKCKSLHLQWTNRIIQEFYDQVGIGFILSVNVKGFDPIQSKSYEHYALNLIIGLYRNYRYNAKVVGIRN